VDDTTYVSGLIVSDTVWTPAGNPHIIEEDLIVGTDAVLRILNGTRILLDTDVTFLVLGSVIARGWEGDSVSFEPLGVGRWNKILFSNSWNNQLAFCSVSHLNPGANHDGSIYAFDSSKVTITNSELRDSFGGGIISFDRCNLTVIASKIHDVAGLALSSFDRSRPHFEGNMVWYTGNDCVDSDYNPAPPKVIRNNMLWDCGKRPGGNASADGIDLDFGFNGDIIGNTVFNANDKGLSVSFGCTPFVQNNIFGWNLNGIVISNSSVVESVNNTIANNERFGVKCYIRNDGYGGGTAHLLNDIVFHNYNGQNSFSIEDSSEITAIYSCIEGDTIFAGEGNINGDPMFVDPLTWDFHLTELSPCIDAARWMWPVTDYDFEGNARWDDPLVDNTGVGSVTYVDIGADEFWYEGAAVDEPDESLTGRVLQAVRIAPLPAKRQLSMAIQLSKPATLKIDFYNVEGRRLDALEKAGTIGWNTVDWDPKDTIGRGVVFYRVRAAGEATTGHAVLLR